MPSSSKPRCDCEPWARSACFGRIYKNAAGKQFCVLHYRGDEKGAELARALAAKVEEGDFDFRGAWFVGEGGFARVIFGKEASFYGAVFRNEAKFFAATFKGHADFRRVEFHKEADFRRATFCADAGFRRTTFGGRADFSFSIFQSKVSFFEARFDDVNFIAATFQAVAEFRLAAFKGAANLSSAAFDDYVVFRGEAKKPTFGRGASVLLQFARMSKPGGASFHTLALRPHWFVNVDARGYEFINVDWRWRETDTHRELESLPRYVSPAHTLLAIACRNLAVNAEENHRYEEASRFRYMAMEARRLETWRGFAFWRLDWWYWLASGYGERVWRAFVVLIGVWLLFAALYTQVGFARWEPRVSSEPEAAVGRDEAGAALRWPRALTYSLGVMTLQKPEPRPATDAAQALVMLETILGPVQAALLALAIRRKFMR